MKIYLAPLESVTGYVFRNAYHDIFDSIDKFYAPFVTPNQNAFLNRKEKKDVLPENNIGIPLVPQIMTNNSAYFTGCQKELIDLGYDEVNLNLGCPSATVVTKKKGAGFLAYPQELDCFLYEIFEKSNSKISIKTRIGVEHPDEFYQLLEIYNKYPLYELIIHPRIRQDFYNNKPNMELFSKAVLSSKNSVVYNGDVNTPEDFYRICEEFPDLNAIMIGRGILKNPGLAVMIKHNKNSYDIEETYKFMERLRRDYYEVMKDEKNVLFKLKELWLYRCMELKDGERLWKKMKKVKNFVEYERVIALLPL